MDTASSSPALPVDGTTSSQSTAMASRPHTPDTEQSAAAIRKLTADAPTPHRVRHHELEQPHNVGAHLWPSGPHAFAAVARMQDEENHARYVRGTGAFPTHHGSSAMVTAAQKTSSSSPPSSVAIHSSIVPVTLSLGPQMTDTIAATTAAASQGANGTVTHAAMLERMRALRKADTELLKMPRVMRAYYSEQNDLIDFYVGVERNRARQLAQQSASQADADAVTISSAGPATSGTDAAAISISVENHAGLTRKTSSKESELQTHTDGVKARTKTTAATDSAVTSPHATDAPNYPARVWESEDEHDAAEAAERLARERSIAFAINASFIANIVLLAIKAYAAASSSSLAVVASTVDSVLDLLSGAVVWLSAWLAARRNPYKFPVGKSRYEPVGIIIFASLMGVASLQIIEQAAIDIAGGVRDGAKASDVDYRTFVILAVIIVIKAILLLICFGLRKISPSVGALALDHLVDIVTNGGTLIAVIVAAQYASMWWLDPAMAIGLALWMVFMWSGAAREQIAMIASQVASPRDINEVTYLAMTHSSSILAVDTVLAYQVGSRLQVEVDIVLPKDMPLPTAHDIGESLQNQIEALPNVERAFVHLDTEFEHARSTEHIPPWDFSK